MATLWITEFENLAGSFNGGPAQAGLMPAVTVQAINLSSAASSTSAALNTDTRLVRCAADAKCHITFSTGSPTATTGDTPLFANTWDYFGVKAGQSVAVISS